MDPGIPDNEVERLAALRRYRVLDTLDEREYDDITLLAAEICDTPIAAISLVDADRQWFKSKVGLATSQTDRSIAFCAHTILDPSKPLIVEDATSDPRFAKNPLVIDDPSIRFYAGAPLRTPDGLAVGTLCVIDRVTRSLTPRQAKALLVLSRAVVANLELRSSVTQLERTVSELQRKEVELQRSRVAELALKDRFISHVSHELRSPLTAIYGFVTLLRDGLVGPLSEKQHECLDATLRNATQLKEMIGDLLDLTRAKAGKLRVQPRILRIEAPIEDAVRDALRTAEGQGITLDARVAAELPPVIADPVRVRQVLANLVENALKHTPAGGRVSIHAEPDPSDPRFARISVRDTGCGIPAAHRERIFEHLYQVERGDEAGRSGLGLGLAICREVVTRQGGRIWVESAPSSGSVFQFTLPLLSLERELASRRPAAQADGATVPAALITVVARPLEGRLAAVHEGALDALWKSLVECLDPTRDVVLPRSVRDASAERFAAVALTDAAGAEVIRRRLERQLGKSGGAEGPGLSMQVECAPLEPVQPGEGWARALSHQVEERLTDAAS